jgi:hypothetical protein
MNALDELPGMGKGGEAVGEDRGAFHGLELHLGVRVVIRLPWLRMRSGDAQVGHVRERYS